MCSCSPASIAAACAASAADDAEVVATVPPPGVLSGMALVEIPGREVIGTPTQAYTTAHVATDGRRPRLDMPDVDPAATGPRMWSRMDPIEILGTCGSVIIALLT